MDANKPIDPNDPRQRAMERLAILDAIVTALDRRAEMMEIVGAAEDADEARNQLRTAFDLTETEATAVLDLQIRRFATRERQQISRERDNIRAQVGLT